MLINYDNDIQEKRHTFFNFITHTIITDRFRCVYTKFVPCNLLVRLWHIRLTNKWRKYTFVWDNDGEIYTIIWDADEEIYTIVRDNHEEKYTIMRDDDEEIYTLRGDTFYMVNVI